jgi:glyoxylase-like metal-dependent hydrolase (beta-lactamase superfamily II)
MAAQRQIGAMKLSRVEEMMIPLIEAGKMFAAFTPEHETIHKDWLSPTYLDPSSKRLNMSIHSWVLRTDHHTILIDTCFGNQRNRPGFRDGHQLDTPWLHNLTAAGVKREEVDFVLCTHLHIDHVGWNTIEENGRFVPTFPNARYLFSKADFDHYNAENEANPERPAQHGAFNDGVLPIVAAGMADMIGAEHAIDDNLLIRSAPGHTPGSITLQASSKGEQGLFTGDILHHPLQVWHPEWNSRFCVDPPAAAKSRRRVLEHCAEHHALMLPAHFARPHCGYVHRQGDAFRFEFAD